MVTGTMATLFLVLSLLGVVAFGALLFLGFRMWGEERAARRAAQAQPPPAAEPTPEALAALEQAAALIREKLGEEGTITLGSSVDKVA